MSFASLVKSVTLIRNKQFSKSELPTSHPARISPTPELNGTKSIEFPCNNSEGSPLSFLPKNLPDQMCDGSYSVEDSHVGSHEDINP